jgi:hypothetical protein
LENQLLIVKEPVSVSDVSQYRAARFRFSTKSPAGVDQQTTMTHIILFLMSQYSVSLHLVFATSYSVSVLRKMTVSSPMAELTQKRLSSWLVQGLELRAGCRPKRASVMLAVQIWLLF